MGQISRREFGLGWQPDADAINAPANAFLRFDNCVLDGHGIVSLRQGSAKVNSAALATAYLEFNHTSDFEDDFLTALGLSDLIAQFTSGTWERAYYPNGHAEGPANHTAAWEIASQGEEYIVFNHTQAFETLLIPGGGGIAQFTSIDDEDYSGSFNTGPGNRTATWESDYIDVNLISYEIETTISSDSDVHSLYTATINGSRYRMAGAADSVYANSSLIWAGSAGSGDIAFGSHQGQILFARSTTKKKYDGSTVRNWGIAAPANTATLTALSSDSKVFATCASAESPGFTGNEGTVGFAADKAGTASAALSLTPDSSTARATATLTYGAATDFTAYTGGDTGTDDDLVEFDLFITEPQYLDKFVVMFDVNDGTFEIDYYAYEFVAGESTDVQLTNDEFLKADYSSEGFDRTDLLSRLESRASTTAFRSDKPVTNTGWNHFSVPRGKLSRFGLTNGKNWATVRAVRVVYQATQGGSGAIARVDAIQIIGGAARPLTGTYKAAIVAVRNDGAYQALSGPNTFSSEIVVKAQGVRATLDTAGLDSQVTELWLYLMGGRTDGFYRYTAKTGGPFGGSVTIDATISDRTAMIANLRLETDNTVPPDTILDIEGPHYDRTLCLTATHIYPSRRLNPDSFATGEAVRVGNASEAALWIKKISENVFVGTTRDIYRMDGDWTPQPDGTINVVKRPMGVTRPPISAAVTVGTVGDSDVLVYLASDGWRVMLGPLLVANQVDLLWRGETRHGVSPVNVDDSAARFRCAISHNTLYAITPEGSDTTSSVVIHAYRFDKQRWYRFTYTPAWRSVQTEPNGVVVAGSTDGFVWTLDEATNQDAGANIPVVLWTPCDDNGQLFTMKEANSLLVRADTGSATATLNFHLDGSSSPDLSKTTAQAVTATGSLDVSTMTLFRQIQMRLTGSFSTFQFRGWSLTYLDRPLPKIVHDTGFVDLTDTTLAWVRRINIKARAAGNLTITPYWDGTAGTARTVVVTANKELVYAVPMGRDDKGTTGRVVITSSDVSYVYWVEFEYNVTGKQRQKRVSLQQEAA